MAKETLYFSALSGGLIYEQTDTIPDPFFAPEWPSFIRNVSQPPMSPLLSLHPAVRKFSLTETPVFLRSIRLDTDEQFQRMRDRISHPPHSAAILWPTDLLELPPDISPDALPSAAHFYADVPTSSSPDASAHRFALAFPRPPRRSLVTLGDFLESIPDHDWTDSRIRQIAENILRLIEQLNQDGYYDNDIHCARFFVDIARKDELPVFLDYSDLMVSAADFSGDAPRPDMDICPREFADPAFIWEIIRCPDEFSQNHSLCALLFYLLFGRLPYDSAYARISHDDNRRTHWLKFQNHYYVDENDNPRKFLFDPACERTLISADNLEDQPVIRRWEQCPEQIRKIFIDAFRQEHVLRGVTPKSHSGKVILPQSYPSPRKWTGCIRSLERTAPKIHD